MRTWLFLASILGASWAHAQSDSEQLAREAGASVIAVVSEEGLAGAVRLSGECRELLSRGERSPHYCLGIEAASMLLLKRGAFSAEKTAGLGWFSGEEMTRRVMSYCYTNMGLHGDMACVARVAIAKDAIEPAVAELMSQRSVRLDSVQAESLLHK